MSLILEALRKREREKQVPERGFLVMAETPWTPARGRSVWVIVTAAALAFGLGGAFVSLRQPARTPSPVTPPQRRPVATARIAASAAPLITLLPAAARPTVSPVALASPPAPATVETPTPLPAATLTAATPSPAAIRLVLQAISERDGQPVALISDHLLREGDTLEGARILHIGETEVELELDGRRLTLRF